MSIGRILATLSVLSWITVRGVVAQEPSDETPGVFARLEGSWSGEGKLFGSTAAFDMRWEKNGATSVLTFANARVDSTGRRTPMLNAVALYRTSRSTPRAAWEDSRGLRLEIQWTASDSLLVSDWSAATESGRTSYRVNADGTVTVQDEVKGAEGLRPFGSATYRRESNSALVTRFLQAYNNHSVDEMLALVTPDIAWYSVVGGTISTEAAGSAALRASMTEHFARRPAARSKFLTITALGRFVTTHERAISTTPTGERSQASVAVYEIEAGRIKGVWYFAAVPWP